jgi:hypothetical protein
MWLIIFGISIAAVLLGFIYMMSAVSRFPGIHKISKGKKIISLPVSFLIIAAGLVIFGYVTSPVNSAVAFLNLILFMLVFEVIAKIIKKPTDRFYWKGWLPIMLCVAYLVTAYFLATNVWRKDYTLTTDKSVGNLKIAMIADAHLGTTFDGEGFAKHLKKIEADAPDILLISGDFADDGTSAEDLKKACEALGEFQCKYGVYFAYGNHDRGYYRDESKGFTAEDFAAELERNGVKILQDEYELIDDRFYVVGREDAGVRDRMSAEELLGEIPDKDKYIIVLDHQPNDYDNEAKTSADLVLSGHTHGGQMVPITYIGELFGINDRTYGYEQREGTDFIVTSGISCWEIIYKSGTKSEYVMITVNGR